MIGELAEGMFGGILRFIGRILTEVMLEVLLRGAGYLFCRLFKKDVDPDSTFVVFAGILVWTLLIFGGYKLHGYIGTQIEIDQCLDSGGKYNYSINSCTHA